MQDPRRPARQATRVLCAAVIALAASFVALPGGHAVAAELPCAGLVMSILADSETDEGWNGLAHDTPLPVGTTTSWAVLQRCSDNQAPCTSNSDCMAGDCLGTCDCESDTNCELIGPVHDRKCVTTLTDCSSNADCPASVACVAMLGAPQPVSVGGTPICYVTYFDGAATGAFDSASGQFSFDSTLRRRVFLGITLDRPCPRCGPPGQNPQVGEAFVCEGGQFPGAACLVEGVTENFGGTSTDCPPSLASGVSGSGLVIDFGEMTTGTVSRVAQLPCANVAVQGNPLSPGSNPTCIDDPGGPVCSSNTDCTRCTGDPTISCDTNADCGGSGTCAEAPDHPVTCGFWCHCGFCDNNPSLPCFGSDQCPNGQTCVVGTGTSTQQNAPQSKPNNCFEDGFLCGHSSSESCEGSLVGTCSLQPFRGCNDDSTCSSNNAGTCVFAPRQCFESRIARTGVPSPIGGYCAVEKKECSSNADCAGPGDACDLDSSRPDVVALACVPGSQSASVNSAYGLTGPAAVSMNTLVRICRCDGSEADCTAVCGEIAVECGNGIVQEGENCDGGECCEPDCSWVPGGTSCRASAGICDVAETCSGSSADCPADGFQTSATTCRLATGVCDAVENCNGTSAACPANGFHPSSTVCRAAMGICDVAESCTGTSAPCPENAHLSSITVCRQAAGVCDVAEVCSGTSAPCPSDSFAASTVTCRAAADNCDIAESCSGTAAVCPSNSLKPAGTACGSTSDDACDNPDTCNGFGVCQGNTEPDGTACDDTNICTVEQCEAGTCQATELTDCQVLSLDPSAGNQFGRAMALTADYLVVGAPAPLNSGSGRAHIFLVQEESGFLEQTQTTPILVPLKDPDQGNPDMDFGTSVDADADTVVVGAPFDVAPVGEKVSVGSASVFVRSGSTWNLQAKLVDATGECTQLGTDVAVSGNTIVLGAPGGNCALVFERSGSDWSLAARLDGETPGMRFGRSVDVSGASLLVGAPGVQTDLTCSGQGAVYAFRRGVSEWALEDTIEEPDGTGGSSCFGVAAGIDGSTGVIGAPGDDSLDVNAGAAYIIDRIAEQWEITAQLLAFPEGADGDGLGASLDIKVDLVLIGAPGVAAYLYQRSAPAGLNRRDAVAWDPKRKYTPPAETAPDDSEFGDAVAVLSRKAVVGAPRQAVDDLEEAGAVFADNEAPESGTNCGDGIVTSGEACDDGDTEWVVGEYCNAECLALACGDSNDSGSLTTSDALFALQAAVGAKPCDLAVCDVNGNGTTTSPDALAILRKAVGQEVTLTCSAAN